MSINKYFDSKEQREMYWVRIVRKTSSKGGHRFDKRVMQIATYNEALKIEKKLLLEADRTLIMAEAKQEEWGTIVMGWYEATWHGDIFARKLTRTGTADYWSVLKNYTSEWNKIRVNELDRATVWLKLDQVERDVSIQRRKKLRSAIDCVFNWAILSGRIKVDVIPTEGFKTNRREEEKLPEILTLDQIKLLLKYAKEANHLWYPIWALALFTGMRTGELFALEWEHVDFENGVIYVHRNWTNKRGYHETKGGYWRAVPIGPQLQVFLKELKLKTGKDKFVLPRFQAWKDGRQAELLRAFCVGMGLPSIKFHTLRACFATQLIRDGIAPAIVMKICGWKDLKTMQRYIRLAGIEVKGATDGLKILPDEDVAGRVIQLFENNV